MPKVTYVSFTGEKREITVPEGMSVMRAAVTNRIPGIVGECGGDLQCATCHVYVDESCDMELPRVSRDEDDMLEGTACERKANSRLSCQLEAGPKLDGLVVHTPEAQY